MEHSRDASASASASASTPIFCANNCGFFGSPETNHLCSKCYRDASKAAVEAAVSVETETARGAGIEAEVEGSGSGGKLAVVKKPANRCSFCNKRVGLMGFKCRCGEVYCSIHRYSDKHGCGFDYKGEGQDAIAKANPIVKPHKVEKI